METPPEAREGLVLLDKPTGMTSHDCVAAIRRGLPRGSKVGHGGTLDPFSTGLLIVMVGSCTRLAPFFQGMDKTYEGVIRFGVGTDTLDRDGAVTETSEPPGLSSEAWKEEASRFVGPQLQIPPAFSAKRVGRVRAYELARKGLAPELAPAQVTVYSFDVTPLNLADVAFRLRCSSGTYVRALARDMGARLGCPAHCLELRRTDVGPFDVRSANTLEGPFDAPGFVPFADVDLGFPKHQADHREERLILNGHKIPARRELHGAEGPVKIVAPSGRFLAVGRVDGRDIQPAVVFPE
jgi:tRNA pseudouridine55 synthase